MAKKDTLKILTANHLLGGHSVFLSPEGEWLTDHMAAKVVYSAEEAEAVLAAGRASEERNEVVGVYWVDVELDGEGAPQPTHYREKLRVRAKPSFWSDAPGKVAIKRRAPVYAQEAGHVSI